MKISGIYLIKNMVNGKGYVGSSSNIIPRRRCHFSELRRGIHHSSHLRNSANKYGVEKFEHYIIALCPIDKLIEKEKFYINYLKTNDSKYRYNIKDPEIHAPLSEEHKRKIGLANSGKSRSQELRERIRKTNTGKKQSKETIEKRIASFNLKKSLGQTWKRGYKHSVQANLEKSIRQTGRKLSEETKQKMRLAKLVKACQ